MHHYGILTFPDGRKYEGGWRNGVRHGEAILKQKDGILKSATFDNGKVCEWGDQEKLN